MAATLLAHHSRLKNAFEALQKRGISIRYAILDPRLPRPVIYVPNSPSLSGLEWTRYAWGVDQHGHYERWTATL